MLQNVAGHDVWVTQSGHGTRRLFLHCALGRGKALAALAQAFGPANNTFFDLPDHGKSGPWTGQDFHSDAVAITQGLIDAPAHLIGHSLGATIALRFAIDYPDLVSRLTLIEPVMFAAVQDKDAIAAYRAEFAPFVRAIEVNDLAKASAIFTTMWGGGDNWANIPSAIQKRITGQIRIVPETAPAIEDDIHDVLGRLDHITCPVDLVEGSESPPIMSAILDGLEARLPRAVRSIIQGGDHMVPIRQPSDVARAIGLGL